ncbi:hypothetical protein AXI64_gp032 [Vibrio phage qdvp001]|nr:hypothetical protein AXI64_gp032 [Vibrio phage qdvp001]ALM62024.1 hypothetical protein qdvp001_032 [Vibrio phage qdvp001]
MNGYKFKLVYVVNGQYDVKYGNNKTRLKVFAGRTMKTTDYTIIDL